MLVSEAKNCAQEVLKEYSTDKGSLFTGFYGADGSSHTGKKLDNIATGESKPYKDPQYLTEYELKYPELAKLTQRAKLKFPNILLSIPHAALKELSELFKSMPKYEVDELNRIIVPVGDNVRLVKQNGQYFIIYFDPEKKKKSKPSDSMITQGI